MGNQYPFNSVGYVLQSTNLMKEEFAILRKFPSINQALEVQAILKEYGIDSEIGDNAPPVDITFSGSTVMNQTEIRIRPSDFEKAYDILEDRAENLIQNIEADYYLFSFTDEELYEILLKPDEWSEFDYVLAQKVLIKRGRAVNDDLTSAMRKERLKQLSEPESNQSAWILAGYFFALTGGLLGILIGFFLWTSKKTLPNGQKVYMYSKKDRSNGLIIFLIGLAMFPIAIYAYLRLANIP